MNIINVIIYHRAAIEPRSLDHSAGPDQTCDVLCLNGWTGEILDTLVNRLCLGAERHKKIA